FYYFFGKGDLGIYIAQAMGFFLVVSCLRFTLRYLRSPQSNSLNLALLAFSLYIGATAFATGGGRLIFGIEPTGRYMTPALTAWAALLMLYVPYLIKVGSERTIRKWVGVFGILLVLMFARQIKALESHEPDLFERKVAALSL